jgi:hypothetical protein
MLLCSLGGAIVLLINMLRLGFLFLRFSVNLICLGLLYAVREDSFS